MKKSTTSVMMALVAVVLAIVAILNNSVHADIPVHCLFSQVKGDWELQLTRSGETKDVVHVCTLESRLDEIETKIQVKLDTPDIIRDGTTGKSIGSWTLIYDQGFELTFGGNKYFAFFNYTKNGDDTISHCDRTFTGTYHTDEVNSKNWGCFRAVKTSSNPLIKMQNVRKNKPIPAAAFTSKFTNDANYIKKINDANLGWTATAYPQFEGKTVMEMQRMAGKRVDRERFTAMKHFGALAKGLAKKNKKTLDLPTNFDWRNVNGVNYITPVRDQGGCGSCYVFASLGSIEARVAIKSNNKQKPILSPQDVVSCCTYSQGCDGGFPYLVSKYAEDFGLTQEECDPYVAEDTKCSNTCPANQTRLYASDFYYVGGYYGATDEQSMMEELYANGPVAVAFQVYRDFYSYKGGIYRHVKALSDAAPEPGWEEVNHGVLLVGWGVEKGTKYWIMKNSWGPTWGDKGFFKIVRGEDNAACESLAVAVTPYGYL